MQTSFNRGYTVRWLYGGQQGCGDGYGGQQGCGVGMVVCRWEMPTVSSFWYVIFLFIEELQSLIFVEHNLD